MGFPAHRALKRDLEYGKYTYGRNEHGLPARNWITVSNAKKYMAM